LIPDIFDRVVLADESGARQSFSKKQFFALPLHLRIKHILARDIEFFLGDAHVVRADALKSLRR
jgi:hypothetical protein